MKVPVPHITPGSYAMMHREDGNWLICIQDELVKKIPDGPEFKSLGLNSYRLLGVEEGVGRVIRFSDLHRHSDCSLLDGMTKISEMVKRTEYSGALTDHGNMYGFLEYYKSMHEDGKHPIIGFEGYMESLDGQLNGRHVILLAENNQGVKNLFKLTSESFDHFRRKPHVTWNMLEQYHEGIICLSACLSGIIPSALRDGNEEGARAAIQKFISIFGTDNFFIEIQRHYIKEEDLVRGRLVQLAQEYGLKIVATTDSHYPDKDDSYPHEVLLCLQTEKTMDDPSRMKYNGTGYHLMNSEEMEDLFCDYPEALDASLEIAERCSVELKLNDVNLPQYSIPKRFSSPMDYMTHLAKQGYKDRFGGTSHESDPVYQERFQYELNMIEQMGFASYFIVVWDVINYARMHNIYVGPGRGSAAGSIVAYCLGITDLDPIKYNLLFERFLNPERVSWPDVDTDIEFSRRPEVIQYLIKKYGAENVCRIVTFGTLAAKQAVRDVGRCLGQPASYNARLSGMIPKGVGMTISKALDISPDFKQAYDSDATAKKIIDIALRLEGNKRHASQHACGVVLAPSAVSDFLPTSMEIDDETKEKALTSQVIMTEVEELSLIKMDFLGLKNMGVIHEVIDRIVENYGKDAILKQIHSNRDEVRYQDIPLNDRKTYQMLAKGMTGGVFQFESDGITKVVTQMLYDIDTLPDNRMDECFERLIAAVALYRPGPMDYIPNYIAGMRDFHNIHYLTPELESILSPTYGVIVFQEQVMQIVQKLAGYSLGRADLVRKAMSKKKQKVMDAEKQVFIYGNKEAYDSGKEKVYTPGAIANGIPEHIAQAIWAQMADFAKYAFNRSHAACYAFIAYITAYMSCYWPEEFYAALLNAFIDNSDKVKSYLAQASHRGIHLLPPDINLSICTFKAEKGDIRFGLQGISGLKGMAERIQEEREQHGPFADFQDLYDRMADRDEKINKRSAEGLIYSGALSSFSDNKAALAALFPKLESSYKHSLEGRRLGQFSLFSEQDNKIPLPNVKRMDDREELLCENEMLGMYLSHHPTDSIVKQLSTLHPQDNPYISLETVLTIKPPKWGIKTIGLIRNVRTFLTRNGDTMASFVLETRYASISCVVFPKSYSTVIGNLQDNQVVGVTADVIADNRTEDSVQLCIGQILAEDSIMPSNLKPSYRIEVNNKDEQDRVIQYIKTHPGDTPVTLIANGKEYRLGCKVRSGADAFEYLNVGYKIS